MSEPRTRTAIEVADHARDLLNDVQLAQCSTGGDRQYELLLDLLERVAAQVEDLAAVTAGDAETIAFATGLYHATLDPDPAERESNLYPNEADDEAYGLGVAAGELVGEAMVEAQRAEDEASDQWIASLLTAAAAVDESWGLPAIIGRKLQGTDNTEEESVIILGAFDSLPPGASRELLAETFPLEWDRWCEEVRRGDRGFARHHEGGPRTLTAGALIAVLSEADPTMPVTIRHGDWWLNVTGLHVPPIMPTTCTACGEAIEHKDGCWVSADGYACPQVTEGDDTHRPAEVQREEPSVQIQTSDDFDTRQW